MALQHKRSSVTNKRPDPIGLSDGQLALNLNALSTGLFYRNASNELVKVGPVHVGSGAPNASPATGGATGNTVGEQWLDTTGGNYVLKVYDGTAWRSVEIEPGSARQLLQTNAAGTDVEFTSDIDVPGTLDVTGAATFDSNVTVEGDLTVNGTTTTIDTQTLLVEDKNIEMGVVTTPTDLTADGGGITLKGATDKTINWVQSTGCWTFNQPTNFNDHVRIASNGMVGIGTSLPGRALHVRAASPVIRLDDSDGTNTFTEIFQAGSATFIDNRNNTSAGAIVFRSFNGSTQQEKVRIDSGGNVGIGTSSPARRLSVTSAVQPVAVFESTGSNAKIYFASSGSTANANYLQQTGDVTEFYTNSARRLRIDSSGNVGIGTNSSVDSPLHVYKQSSDRTARFQRISTQYIDIIQTSGVNELESTGKTFALGTSDSNPVTLRTNDSERMRIDSSGNVGIGTTSPAAPLNISNSIPIIRLTDSDGTNTYGQISASTGALTFAHRNNASNGQIIFQGLGGGVADEYARFDSSGRLLVGTSSSVGTFSGISPRLQLEGTSYDSATASIYQNNSDAQTPAILVLGKSRGSSTGSSTSVANNDRVGVIEFNGADGTTRGISLGNIAGFVDGTPGTNDMPGRLVFSTTADGASSPTERMRIDSSGRLLVGTTSTAANTEGIALVKGGESFFQRNNGIIAYFNLIDGSSNSTAIQFRRGNSAKGSINIGTTSTSYNTTSDYRLKENVIDIADGITRVKQLQPKRFNFIADDATTVDGFLAHEAQTVVPEAITGTHDEVDDEGNPVYQGIDQSKLVPLLTAALKEAIAKIETLEQRLSDAGIA